MPVGVLVKFGAVLARVLFSGCDTTEGHPHDCFITSNDGICFLEC